VGRRLLAYDTTNFYTYVASTNTRNELAQRGHNKQGRHHLRQVGLSYVLDADNGLSLCHHVSPGNVADADELPDALARIGALLDHNQIARDSVTLVLDKGSAALANTLELEKARVGWISALPWNQAPAELRSRGVEQLPTCGSAQPGVRAAAEKLLVHGKEYLCVLKYSACFAAEQLHSTTATLTKVTQKLRRLVTELSKPQARFTEQGIRNKIHRWLADPFVREVLHYTLEQRQERWHLTFQVDNQALQQLWSPLRANIDETLTAAIITEQGGKERHRERNQDCSSFRSQFAGFRGCGQATAAHL
jgi:transposase